MASWKKVIVSGSAAELSSLTLDTALPVAQGGTNATSLADKSVLITQDSGTDTVSALALTSNGSIIVGGTGGPAVEAASDVAGTGLTAVTGDGTLVINVDAAQTQITDVGTLDAGAISSGFGNIDNGTSTLNTGNATVNNLVNDSSVANSRITGSFTGSFVGDGTGLTGTGLDIDSLSALGGTGLHQTQDHFVFSDNGTEKKITFSNLEDAIFGNISGDVTIAAGGTSTIGADTVANSMLENMTRGTVKVGGNSNAPTDLDASTNGQILIGDGTDIQSVAVSGDISLDGDGQVTIAANAVEGSMLNSNVAGTGLDYGSNQLSVDVSDFMTNGSNNRVLTATGTDGQNAEANLTFDGSTLALTGALTVSTNATIDGNLTVNGTQTSVNTTNLLVEDRFILLNSGSASGDGGLIVQTESGFSGSAFVYDDTESRFGFQIGTKLGDTATTSVPDAYASSVVTSDLAAYRKNGNIRVQSGDIFIYVE